MSGLKIVKDAAPAGAIVSDRRLWLTADKARVVEDGDAAAAFLFAAEGGEISSADAGRFGLAVEDGRVVLLREPEEEVDESASDEAGESEEEASGEAGESGDGGDGATGEEASDGAEDGAGSDADAAGEEAGEGAGDEASAKSEAKPKKDSSRNKTK